MTDADAQDFVVRLAAIWAAGNSDAFLTLWHQDCILHTPILEQPLPGRDLPRLHRAQMAATPDLVRSEEHTSELQSLMRISYAGFCLKKKKQLHQLTYHTLTAN